MDRLAAAHTADPLAVELGVDLVADPNREDDDGYVWARLHAARDVRVVVPGSAVVIGSDVGEWIAKVIAWDFEVSDDDPIITTTWSVVYERTATGWSAYVPALLGLAVAGATRAEVEQRIRDGIPFHLEGLAEDGLPIPDNSSVEVQAIAI